MTQPQLLGGRYELDGIVGRGGMAEVFRARDIRLDRIVAVKTLRDDLARDQTFQARFRREAQSAASLNHPSIVAVYDTGEDMVGPIPVPYIVMEYVDGRTLRDLLRDDRRLLPERALEITDGVLRALDYSHRNGIVHRDIKPGNVMLTRSGEVKVMDFGIARAVSDSQATMTQTAQVIGTAQYLSPEQARGERVDARSDLYSAGCLLYELLTGRPPFTGDSPVAIAYQHVREQPVPPSQVDPEIPAWADSIVLRAMEKDAGRRYQSAGDMRDDIQRALSGVPVAAPARTATYQGTRRMGAATAVGGRTGSIPPYEYDDELPPPPEKRRKWPWIVAIVVAIALIGALIFVFQYISSGGSKYAVPGVDNQPVATAQTAVVKAHLIPKTKDQASSTVPKGDVIRTSPPNGHLVAKNSIVTLFVSTGPGKTKVPGVKGKSVGAAKSILKDKGFLVTTQSVTSSAPAGQVVEESPPGGTLALPGTTVILSYSSGPPVPSVVGDSVHTARLILRQAGFTVVTRYGTGPNSIPVGDVFQQDPAGNSPATGTQVIIYVQQQPSAPPTPTPTPTTPTPTPTSSSPSPPTA
jgi:beta-lactam-binding protein with PASTA domain/tRNA A-37 threonylcarbamoyl transferase component Bud32